MVKRVVVWVVVSHLEQSLVNLIISHSNLKDLKVKVL